MCEAQDFLKLVLEEVEDQIDHYRYTEDELLSKFHRRKWSELYRKYKHLLYDNKREITEQVKTLARKIRKIDRQVKGLQNSGVAEFPHISVINKWLMETLKIEWRHIPYKYQTKDTMKPELLKFIQEKTGHKIKNPTKLRIIDEMLKVFETKCVEMHAKEEQRQKDSKKRHILIQLNNEKKAKLMERHEYLFLKKKYIEEDRNAMLNEIRDSL